MVWRSTEWKFPLSPTRARNDVSLCLNECLKLNCMFCSIIAHKSQTWCLSEYKWMFILLYDLMQYRPQGQDMMSFLSWNECLKPNGMICSIIAQVAQVWHLIELKLMCKFQMNGLFHYCIRRSDMTSVSVQINVEYKNEWFVPLSPTGPRHEVLSEVI